MKKSIIFLLFLYPILLFGQGNGVIVGSIGGTINASMYGGAIYSIPIELPRGIGNMQPEIGLIYNNQGGNGLLGFGWNLSGISSITRTGSTLFHDGKMTAANLSSDDRFMLDGQRLIRVGPTGNDEEYKTEQDEFSKIVLHKENGYYSKCEVWLENGNIIRYGYTSDSKLMSNDGNNVIKWMVNSITDRNGNSISYTYETSGTDSDVYISQISYTSNIQANMNPEFTISFTYSNNRFDKYHHYIAGNKITSKRLLTAINVSKAGNIIETYSFVYDGNSNRMYNLLKRISLSKGAYELNPTLIVWNTDDNDIHNNALSTHEINQTVLNDFSFVGDVNGDGYTDLISVPYRPNNGYTGDVIIKVYLNDRTGTFSSTPNTTITAPSSLEWVHVFDINGDGYDDIILQTLVKTINGNNTTYTSGFTVYASSNGSFTNAYSTTINGEVLAKVGDFLGEGRNSLFILKLHAWNVENTYYFDGYPDILHYTGNYSLNTFTSEIFGVGNIITDDFTGDGKSEIIMFGYTEMVLYSCGIQNNNYIMSETVDDFNSSDYTSFFTGDFNNDGKADIMYNDFLSNYKYVVLSTGTGFTNPIYITNSGFTNITFPYMGIYKPSLARVSSNSQYGINFSDIDGDGKTDIIFYDGDKKPTFYKDFIINDGATTGDFKTVSQVNNEDIVFKNQYFTMGNFMGVDHMSFIAIDPQTDYTTSDDIINIYTFPSSNEVFSVNSITDGFGNTTELQYSYMMPGNSDFYHLDNRQYTNDFKPVALPLLAMKSFEQQVAGHNYKTSYEYVNLLLHKTGRGIIGFDNIKRKSYIDNNLVKIESGWTETTTMGINAVALPAVDSVFTYNNGNAIISETSEYTFDNVRCNRQVTNSGKRLIVRPAMTSQKTKHFDSDQPGNILSVEIVDYDYSYSNDFLYSNTYSCTEIANGINGTDCASSSNCEFQNTTNITYLSDNVTDWIINRKSEEISTADKTGKPTIARKTLFDYSLNNPYLISRCTKVPSTSLINPLTTRTDYIYDTYGNVISETKIAPMGIHNEPSITTQYSYINGRLLGSKTVDPNGLAYQELYSYDAYDRITRLVGSDNLTTTYSYANTFGTTVIKTAPDNVTTMEATGWASGVNYAPSNALYYKLMSTTGKPMTMAFYDAAGNNIRTLTENHQLDPIIVDVVYDEKQLPTQKSKPYEEGDSPLWITYQYDNFGRPTVATMPDGTTTSYTYNGLKTIITKTANNTIRTEEKIINPAGWLICSKDAANNAVTYDYYADGKLASTTTSGGNITVGIEYDNAGNRVLLSDPDYGETSYIYDAYGRLVKQESPKGDVFNYEYDLLGRPTQKYDISESTTTSYQYNENSHKGTLGSITHNGQLLEYIYDNYNRMVTIRETRDSVYVTNLEYDQSSRISSRQYPSGFKVYYDYYPNGTPKSVKDVNNNILWRTDDVNACGQLLQSTNGSNIVTTNTYDASTDRLLRSVTNNNIQKFIYTYDGWGNLLSRTDSIISRKTESFSYDNLDRLTGAYIDTISSFMSYDNYGRIIYKQKDGQTVFESARYGSYKPHAIKSASVPDNVFPTKQTITYTSFDKVQTLSQDSKIAVFSYGYNNQRTRMIVTDTLTGATTTKSYAGDCEFVDDNGTYKIYTYLSGPYGVFAIVVKTGGSESVNYIFKDHIGSWTTITDSSGNVNERRSFDAWGNFRDAGTWKGTPSRPPHFDRGFTGHEHLYDFGLINMNGRVYDPLTSSFLSPDNYVQDPTTQQGFNRYAYCMYNPLKYVDPSGYRFFGYDEGAYYRMLEEITQQVFHEWYSVYDMAVANVQLTINMACCLFGRGIDTHASGSGHHGAAGGGSVEAKYLGNGKYEVVNGLNDGGNTVYVVDDQGNRTGEVLGYTLTPYTFYDQDDKFIEHKIIDLNDSSGQNFWDTNTDDLPFKIVYEIDMIFGARGGLWESAYDFKNFEKDVYRAMAVDFGFGSVIATGRDIGNFFAGYLWGFSGTPYIETRTLFNLFQLGPEPHVSQYAQDFGYFWGLINLIKHNKKP